MHVRLMIVAPPPNYSGSNQESEGGKNRNQHPRLWFLAGNSRFDHRDFTNTSVRVSRCRCVLDRSCPNTRRSRWIVRKCPRRDGVDGLPRGRIGQRISPDCPTIFVVSMSFGPRARILEPRMRRAGEHLTDRPDGGVSLRIRSVPDAHGSIHNLSSGPLGEVSQHFVWMQRTYVKREARDRSRDTRTRQ